MYNFKEFFKRNYDFPILLEAYRGSYSKKPVLYDDEDLDFLYQFDQKNWVKALKYRYDLTWKALRRRQEVRNKIIREMLSEVKASQFVKPVEFKIQQGDKEETRKSYKLYINSSNIEEFKKLILRLGESYDNYGNRIEMADPSELSRRKQWLDQLFDEYDIENIYTRGAKDNQRAIKDIIYEIIKRIVIYVKGGDEETYSVEGKNAKLYINRLIQKLETTKDEDHHIKAKLENLSEIYGKNIYFEKTGKYGFDLSNPRRVQTVEDGKKTILLRTGHGENGYIFPKQPSIRDSLHRLYALNYHRHLGELPTDDPNHTHDITYKSIQTVGGGKSGVDQFSFNVLKNNISNDIKKFLLSKKSLDWYSGDIEGLLKASINPEDEKEKMVSGIWFVRSMLNDSANEEDIAKISPRRLKKIFHTPEDLYDRGIEQNKENGKIGIKVLRWITSYQNVSNNRKLRDIFSDYFGQLRASDIIKSQSAYGPKILSVNITGDPVKDAEIRKKELEKLDEKDRQELKSVLGEEDWEKFVKTGRLPYKITKKEIKVGKNPPPIILPHIKKGEGKDAIYFPLLRSGKYVRQIGISSEEDVQIEKLQSRIERQLSDLEVEDAEKYSLDSIEDLEKLEVVLEELGFSKIKRQVEILIQKLKTKESTEKKIITTPRSSSIINSKGEEIPIVKYHRTKKYEHGLRGTILAAPRPVASSSEPGAVAKKSKKIGIASIFPFDSPVLGPDGTLVDEKIWNFFKTDGKLDKSKYPENARPMKMIGYKISNNLEGFDLSPNPFRKGGILGRNIGENYFTNWQENIDLNKFLIIKENESEDETSGPKKTTEKYNRVGNIWWTIERSEAPNIYGYNDIIEGMKHSLLFGSFGGYDAESLAKNYYLQYENFQKVHDEIVKQFWENAEDVQLHYSKTRRERAASIMSKILQKKIPELEGSVSRKLRTGFEVKGDIKSKEFKPTDIELKDIKPLNIEENKDLLKDIFLDFEHPLKIKDETGVPRVWLTMGGKPFSFRGQAKLPKKAESEEPSFSEYLVVRSKILTFTMGSLSKVNSSNYTDIKNILVTERDNLIKYWGEIFNKIKDFYKSKLKTFSEVELYFEGSNANTIQTIKRIYAQEIKTIEDSIKSSTKEPIKGNNVERVYDDNSPNGIKELEDIIDDINRLIQEIPNFKISKKPNESTPDFHVTINPLVYKEDRDLPGLVNWFNMIVSILKSFRHVVTHEPGGPSLLTFIATQKGGLSSRLSDLRYPVHDFLNRIDKNIKDFVKILSDKLKDNPNYIEELRTTNRSKAQSLEQSKNLIKTLTPKLSDSVNKLKQNLITILRK